MRLPIIVAALSTSLAVLSASPAARCAPTQESLLELLPAKAKAAAILRHNGVAPLRSTVGDDPEMLQELGAYLDRTVGIDLTKIDGAAIFSSDITVKKPGAAVLLRVPVTSNGPLKLPLAGDAGGTPLYRV